MKHWAISFYHHGQEEVHSIVGATTCMCPWLRYCFMRNMYYWSTGKDNPAEQHRHCWIIVVIWFFSQTWFCILKIWGGAGSSGFSSWPRTVRGAVFLVTNLQVVVLIPDLQAIALPCLSISPKSQIAHQILYQIIRKCNFKAYVQPFVPFPQLDFVL